MIVERSMHPRFLSNTYLVASGSLAADGGRVASGEGDGEAAFFIDAGGPVQPLIEAAGRLGVEPTHVLLTHHHFDHVSETPKLRARWPQIEALIAPREQELAGDALDASGSIEAGSIIALGGLDVRALHTPGHTAGMLSFLVSERQPGDGGAAVFTGDTLFKGSVGGVRAPGHTSYGDLKVSIMETLMALAPQTVIYPGHAERTSVGEEWECNAFIRVWRGLDPEGAQRCKALGEPATLILLGDDYDGGHKAWVRWPDGSDDIVPGSRVELED
jgi:hydroxyacylglutathione hydrolase